ncbi:MAG: hypothetical protein PHX54_14105 [Lentimicrobiaceae bacterium]|nr:hypothetical protein [Lentimicrobiaceae bacterium]
MIVTRLGNHHDIDGVLALQEKYLYSKLTESERMHGFVTTPFTADQLIGIIKQNGLFVANDQNHNIVAYAFAGSWKYFEQWEIFRFMVSRFPLLSFKGNEISTVNSFQYGPICIDKQFRGSGLLNLLFEEMRIEFLKTYPISVTFINKVNIVSTQAHVRKLNWQIMDEFEFNHKIYLGLAFDMKFSVLKPVKIS